MSAVWALKRTPPPLTGTGSAYASVENSPETALNAFVSKSVRRPWPNAPA